MNTESESERRRIVARVLPIPGLLTASDDGAAGAADRQLALVSESSVTTGAAVEPVPFHELSRQTDLRAVSANWHQRDRRLDFVLPRRQQQARTAAAADPEAAALQHAFASYTSFAIADHSLTIGRPPLDTVDMVGDAENVKRLLKLPYSRGDVSMAIHRIGSTLLVDNMDVRKLQRPDASPLDQLPAWVRELLEDNPGLGQLPKKKNIHTVVENDMYDKFLYYSAAEASRESAADDTAAAAASEPGSQGRPVAPATRSAPSAVGAKLPHRSTGFKRVVHWSFHNMSLLVGSNLPIFGDDKHPAVSLKLRDASRPINVLTGIDDWLDNLMCNVPEVAMCYHLNGVIQGYDLFKTHELPYLHTPFSPTVIKETAQSLMSFLKANCTREGGTYWLFRGPGDDFIKLYDLSVLFDEFPDDAAAAHRSDADNPFAFPVAVLLYKLARNLRQQQSDAADGGGGAEDGRDGGGDGDDAPPDTLRSLLRSSAALLHRERHRRAWTAATTMLAESYLLPMRRKEAGGGAHGKQLALRNSDPGNADMADFLMGLEYMLAVLAVELNGAAAPSADAHEQTPDEHQEPPEDSSAGPPPTPWATFLERALADADAWRDHVTRRRWRGAAAVAVADGVAAPLTAVVRGGIDLARRRFERGDVAVALRVLESVSVCTFATDKDDGGGGAFAELIALYADALFRSLSVPFVDESAYKSVSPGEARLALLCRRHLPVESRSARALLTATAGRALSLSPAERLSAAVALYLTALSHSRALDALWRRLGGALNELGAIALNSGRFSAAAAYFARALAVFAGEGDVANECLARCNIGRLCKVVAVAAAADEEDARSAERVARWEAALAHYEAAHMRAVRRQSPSRRGGGDGLNSPAAIAAVADAVALERAKTLYSFGCHLLVVLSARERALSYFDDALQLLSRRGGGGDDARALIAAIHLRMGSAHHLAVEEEAAMGGSAIAGAAELPAEAVERLQAQLELVKLRELLGQLDVAWSALCDAAESIQAVQDDVDANERGRELVKVAEIKAGQLLRGMIRNAATGERADRLKAHYATLLQTQSAHGIATALQRLRG